MDAASRLSYTCSRPRRRNTRSMTRWGICGGSMLHLPSPRRMPRQAPRGEGERLAMIRSGEEYLESLRDGRAVYVGGERVDDVTTHPGFRNAARSYAKVFDARFDPRFRDLLSYEEDGARHAMYYLRPRSRGGPGAPVALGRGHRRLHLRHDGPLARLHRRLRLGRRHAAGSVRQRQPALRRQPARLLRAVQARGPLPLPRGDAAARSQGRELRGPRGRHGADGARRHGGTGRRRGHQRPQDAGHQRRLQRSRLDRQHSAARQGPREGVDHLRHPGERAGAEPLVAQAVRALRRQRGRQPDGLPLRRERLHRRLRRGQGARGSTSSPSTTSSSPARSTSAPPRTRCPTTRPASATARSCGCCSVSRGA